MNDRFTTLSPRLAPMALALLLASCAESAQSASVHRPMPSPDGSRLTLMSDRDGNWETYVLELSDGSSRRITNDPAFDGYADWSPDGRILYFGSSGAIRAYDLEGGEMRSLGEGGALRVAPDGSEIVFQSERSGDRELYRMKSDGSSVQRLTEHPGTDQDASISPDGSSIAYVSVTGEDRALYLMHWDGGGRRRLTDGLTVSYGTDWSPDGRSIVFTAEVEGDQEIFMVDVASGETRRLTNRPGIDHMPVFWPDGLRVLYTAYVEEEGEEREQLRLLDLGGESDPVPLKLEADGRLTPEALAILTRRPVALVFDDVHVVTMESEEVLAHQTVVVRGDRIQSIVPTGQTTAPAGALVIAGRGRYLAPGLMDLHTHPDDARALGLYVAHGVTTIRDMGGDEGNLSRRDRVASGGLAGPTVLVAGPPLYLEGEEGDQELRDPDAARRRVREIAEAGFDSVKLVRLHPPEAVAAVIEEAGRAGLQVAGHLPTFDWSLAELAASGMTSVEHITEVLWMAFGGRADPREIGNAVEELRSGGIAVGTLLTSGLRAKQMIDQGETYLESSDAAEIARWYGPQAAEGARSYLEYLSGVEPWQIERRRIDREFALRFVAALHRGGVPLAPGTDSHTPWAIAGAALHDELGLYVEAGLTPYQALRTATVDGAELLGIGKEAGTVAVGKRADLVLVAANPLADLETLRRPEAVVAAGRWYERSHLDRLLSRPPPPAGS